MSTAGIRANVASKAARPSVGSGVYAALQRKGLDTNWNINESHWMQLNVIKQPWGRLTATGATATYLTPLAGAGSSA